MAATVGPLALGGRLGGPLPVSRRPGTAAARITRLTLTPVEGRFHKLVAMNSYDTAPKGHTYGNTLVRLMTDQGVEGVGVMEYATPDDEFRAAVRALVGADAYGVYAMVDGRVTGRAPAFEGLLTRYPHLDGPLFDLIGKLEGKPAWQLIGDAVRDDVEAYDGTLYFSDVWFQDRGARAVVEEAEEAARKGYPALKLKVGRGWRWMEKEEGLRRDIEVVKEVRRAVGPDVRLLVDANNGYRRDPEDAWRLLEATAEDGLYFLEEPYPEDVAEYGRLKDRIQAAGLDTLIADGENLTHPEPFAPYLEPRRLIDVLQLDIRRGGILGNLRLARMGEPVGAVTVPHNWGSQVGLFMSLHFAKAVPNVAAAEDDRSTMDAIVAEGYEFRRGRYTVSDAPGLGIRVDEETYERKYARRAEVIEGS
jgi:L-alanine-DL-glutamate epimerase-like enolase superfamily enzyme